jgi:DNA mismatch endonuclease (patch repair protein)
MGLNHDRLGGVSGWRLQPEGITGKTDFVFDNEKVVVFVDGCFWHGGPVCGRRPKSNQGYWKAKIDGNIDRDKRNREQLHKEGWTVLQVWEHEFGKNSVVMDRLKEAINS